MQITAGIIGYIAIVALAHVGQFYVCDSTLPSTSDDETDTFETFQNYASFNTCDGNSVFSFAMFTLFTLPVLLILVSALFLMFNNAITGAILGALLLVTGLVAIFS